MPTRPARLRKLLESPALAFLMEAHNALSARIAEEAGFNGIWASGLSMAAALGVRDANEASWTQVLDVLEFIARYLLPRVGRGSRLLNSQYVGSRLLYGLARRSCREATGWLPNLALYLFQLDALAGRNQAALRAA